MSSATSQQLRRGSAEHAVFARHGSSVAEDGRVIRLGLVRGRLPGTEHSDELHYRTETARQLARDRYELCDPRNRVVAADAEERLEIAMQARIQFEQRQATAAAHPNIESSDDELQVLCDLV